MIEKRVPVVEISDIDVVADIRLDQVSSLIAEFPFPEFYVEEHTARDAILRRSQFNILHASSGFKIDLMILKDNDYDRLRNEWELVRKRVDEAAK